MPKTYDDIVRTTVPEMDSSMRPTREQEQQAREGFRATDADEQALSARVSGALAGSGLDVSKVNVEIERDRVVLRGQVTDTQTLARIAQSGGIEAR